MDVLEIPQIGTNQNFFHCGGDSILSLQIVSRARRRGIIIAPRNLFEHPTIAELASVAQYESCDLHQVAEIDGPAPLTPIQSWFFAQPIPNRDHWNQRIELTPRRSIDFDLFGNALRHLVEHHASLKLRFRQVEGAWRQEVGEPTDADELLSQRTIDQTCTIVDLWREADQSLDPALGQVLRCVGVTTPEGAQRILLSIHHLVVDGVSWRILIEDLETAYRQLEADQPVHLPPTTASYQQWARRLSELAVDDQITAEAGHWTQVTRGITRLPCDRSDGHNTRHHARQVTLTLDMQTTDRLTTTATRAYRTRPDDLILTALARVIGRWAAQPEILVEVEGHGRDLEQAKLYVSRTTGWFTTAFPVRLPTHGDLPASIKAVKEALRCTPGNGAGYGLSRYLAGADRRAVMDALPEAQIAFNYLGQVRVADDALFAADVRSMTLSTDDRAPLGKLLTVDALAADHGLEVRWTFSADIYNIETVEALAAEMLGELQRVVDHCHDEGNAGATPSDFPVARLTQSQIDLLELPWRQIEDIHPLTPLQQGILFHSLYAPPDGNVYVNQLSTEIDGLDLPRFLSAWKSAVQRHAVLRSAFIRHHEIEGPAR